MKEQRLHTPDGVRDIYNSECQKKLALQDKLHQTLSQYGYQDIQTPTIEFFNIFSQEIGTTPSKDLYKFFDKEGNTLVLRPDFTPSIARSAAKYYMDDILPVKLCYMGNTFVNSSDYQLKLKETTQCGAELIGDSSSFADAEILSMVVDSLRACGLEDFKITVGHSLFLPSLLQAANANENIQFEIEDYLANKNFFGVEEVVDKMQMDAKIRSLFALLGNYDLSIDELKQAMKNAKDYDNIYRSLSELDALFEQLKMYGIEKYVSCELGIVSGLHYYTGVIFSGYTFGTGEAIVNGGRYDKLLSYFGKNAPAIGFAINVDQLMAAVSRQKIDIPIPPQGLLLIYSEANHANAIQKAISLRKSGQVVELIQYQPDISKEEYQNYCTSKRMAKMEFMLDQKGDGCNE